MKKQPPTIMQMYQTREALRLCLAELKLVVSMRPTLMQAIDAAEKALGESDNERID